MASKTPPCPSCEINLKGGNVEENYIVRIPVCSTCLSNYYSNSPDQKSLDIMVDRLSDELHDYINNLYSF